jgi:hypothetical protein
MSTPTEEDRRTTMKKRITARTKSGATKKPRRSVGARRVKLIEDVLAAATALLGEAKRADYEAGRLGALAIIGIGLLVGEQPGVDAEDMRALALLVARLASHNVPAVGPGARVANLGAVLRTRALEGNAAALGAS